MVSEPDFLIYQAIGVICSMYCHRYHYSSENNTDKCENYREYS